MKMRIPTDKEYDKLVELTDGDNAKMHWYSDLGFRPAVEVDHADLPADITEGDTVVMGTLYMNGEPVRVPLIPTRNGDTEEYILGAKLELGEPLEDPKYQMTGIYIGDGVVVADRVMLEAISFNDLCGSDTEAIASVISVRLTNLERALAREKQEISIDYSSLKKLVADSSVADIADGRLSQEICHIQQRFRKIQSLQDQIDLLHIIIREGNL